MWLQQDATILQGPCAGELSLVNCTLLFAVLAKRQARKPTLACSASNVVRP